MVDYIAQQRIPIELCLTSNVKTKAVESVDKYPVRHYFDRGINISINTDDPKMFGNSLAEEYNVLETSFGFSRDEIRSIILQGIETSWLPDNKNRELVKTVNSDAAW